MKKLIYLLKRVIHYYNVKQIPLASAALCYYMMMTVFPMIICLYTLLGQNYDQALRILEFAEGFLSSDTLDTIRSFLAYVEDNHSLAMAIAGLTVMITSASAAVRSMLVTIGRMQGGLRYTGITGFVFSVLYSVVFLAATWFAIIVMFSSRNILNLIRRWLPIVEVDVNWHEVKYWMLAIIMFLILWGMYRFSREKGNRYFTWPGAIFATFGIVGMSLIFSGFIAVSARYSLVYGSLASVILLMYWIYLICQVIYIGAAINVSLRDLKKMSARQRERKENEN
ncbi:MAG: YihY/virulence factor BrkB family protein [Clostridia bacterium]|nr:YihY/virulence factor BrkB family protein [Clostridia bacterium]